jgi:hypothetical protein
VSVSLFLQSTAAGANVSQQPISGNIGHPNWRLKEIGRKSGGKPRGLSGMRQKPPQEAAGPTGSQPFSAADRKPFQFLSRDVAASVSDSSAAPVTAARKSIFRRRRPPPRLETGAR